MKYRPKAVKAWALLRKRELCISSALFLSSSSAQTLAAFLLSGFYIIRERMEALPRKDLKSVYTAQRQALDTLS